MAAFTIQHINDYDVPSTGGSQTLTAVDMSRCVVLNTNNFFMSGGPNGSSANQTSEDVGAGIDLTSTTNVNFNRDSGAGTTTRCSAAAWEYTGSAGGPNEFLVRSRGNVSLTSSTRTTTATCTTTPTSIHDCVVFITGITHTQASASFDDTTAVAWLSGTNTINFERGGNSGTTTLYYTVVEFTGSNWTVHHGFSGDVTGDTGSITLYDQQKGAGLTSTVAAWNKAFIFGLFKGDDTANNLALADLYPIYDPGTGTGTVDWTFDANHDASDNQHLVYVIENSDSGFSVARYNTGAITLPANDQTTTITAVTSLTEALCLNTVETSGTGSAYARGVRNSGFNSTTQVYSWCHRSGNTGQIEYQVIDFNGMAESGSQTLSSDYIASSHAVYEPTVSPGAVTLTSDYISTSYQIFEPSLTPGAVTLTSDYISSSHAVYEPTLTSVVTLSSDYIGSSYQVYEPTLQVISTTVSADFIGSSNQVYEPTLTPGPVSLTADYISTSYQIHEPTLTSTVTLSVDFISSGYQVYEPVATTPTPQTLDSDYISTSYQVFEPTLTRQRLQTGAYDDERRPDVRKTLDVMQLVYKEYREIRRQKLLRAINLLNKELNDE